MFAPWNFRFHFITQKFHFLHSKKYLNLQTVFKSHLHFCSECNFTFRSRFVNEGKSRNWFAFIDFSRVASLFTLFSCTPWAILVGVAVERMEKTQNVHLPPASSARIRETFPKPQTFLEIFLFSVGGGSAEIKKERDEIGILIAVIPELIEISN